MSTTDHEGPEMPNGAYTGMSVKDLENHLTHVRQSLKAYRSSRDRIKAEMKIARAREAAEANPIPENPGWDVFEFNARIAGRDRTRTFTASQEDGRIAVVGGDDYWFFESWEGFVSWFRDPELVVKVSRLRPMMRTVGHLGISAR